MLAARSRDLLASCHVQLQSACPRLLVTCSRPASALPKLGYARPAVTVAGSPACSYSLPSNQRSRVSCSALPPKRRTGPALNDLPCSLEDAEEELRRIAAPGSRWPAEARAPIQAAADALGGQWFVVDCGHWAGSHPKAGVPAVALLQLTFITVQADDQERKYTVKKEGKKIEVMEHPGDHAAGMMFPIMYELDDNLWPTGAAYNTASAFEKQTDKKHLKKILSSCCLWYYGRDICRLQNYFNKVLKPQQVDIVPKQIVRVVQDWTRDQLDSLGVNVMRVDDCISRARRSFQDRQEIEGLTGKRIDGPGHIVRGQPPLDPSSTAPRRPTPGPGWQPYSGNGTGPAQPPAKPSQPDDPDAPPRVRRSRRTGI